MSIRIKYLILIISLFSILFTGCERFKKNPTPRKEEPKKIETPEEETINFTDNREAAMYKAKKLYEQKKAEGIDFSSGPCLSDEIIVDWVADIAHNPREGIDEKIENQCEAYRTGETNHFVELDVNGNVIRAI